MKYKNISKQTLIVPDVGVVEAGEVIETSFEINNSNFEKVIEKEPAKEPEDKVENKQ